MRSAASQRSSIAAQIGPMRDERRARSSNARAQSTRVSATDVRELVSSAIERTSAHRPLRVERHRCDRPARGDRHIRHDRGTALPARADTRSRESGRRRSRRRAAARRTRDGTSNRSVERGDAIEPVHERTRVQIADRAEADARSRGHRGCSPRTAGLEAAVALDRLLAGRADVATDLLERRAAAPSAVSSSARHGVDVVGADGQRDLSELGAVQRPVDLDRRHVVDDSRASATRFTSSYPVVGTAGLNGAAAARTRGSRRRRAADAATA